VLAWDKRREKRKKRKKRRKEKKERKKEKEKIGTALLDMTQQRIKHDRV